MCFRKHDIEEQLGYGSGARSGSYNQLQWSIRPGNDYTNLEARIISIHEFLHNELNNITGYGFLLQAYAYLSREKCGKQEFYQDLLCDLVGNCREAHEAYATWTGFTVFKRSDDDDIETRILEGNHEYLAYYNKADCLARGFESLFIKQQVVSAGIRFCFQGKKIAAYGLNNLETFQLDNVAETDFPNHRFNYIINCLPDDFFRSCVLSFIRTLNDSAAFSLLMDAFNGKDNTQELLKMENDHLARGLMSAVYAELRKHFDEFDSPSLNDREEHLTYFANLLKHLDIIFPFSQSSNPLFLNQVPDDYDRSVALNFENETLILSEKPLPCIILRVEGMSESTRAEILKGMGAEPHLFIMGRYSSFLKEQYRFKYKEDEEWFSSFNAPFTCIRYAGWFGNERTVVLVPFNTPDQLNRFLEAKSDGFPLLGCVSISAAYHKDWWALWGDFFTAHCSFSCLLLDVSPLYYIEQVFPDEELVTYTKIILSAEETVFTALLFEVKEAGNTKAIMLAPATDVHCQILHHYIITRHPSYVNNQSLSQEAGAYIPTMLSHVMREEHTYSYHSQHPQFP